MKKSSIFGIISFVLLVEIIFNFSKYFGFLYNMTSYIIVVALTAFFASLSIIMSLRENKEHKLHHKNENPIEHEKHKVLKTVTIVTSILVLVGVLVIIFFIYKFRAR